MRTILLTVIALTVCVPAATQADVIHVGPHMQLVSTNAINATTTPAYDVDTAFDGLLNSDELNGAVFDLPANSPAVWTVNLSGVAQIENVMLYQLVGGIADNGIEDFEITFYAGNAATGNVLHAQAFGASLNGNNSSETFAFSTTVANPESFTFSVTSAHGNETRAEFSEIQFNGIIAVPEPSSVACLVLITATGLMARRRKQ